MIADDIAAVREREQTARTALTCRIAVCSAAG